MDSTDKIDISLYPKAKASSTVSSGREIPHDYNAEQSVLGCILLDNAAWETASSSLRPEDFYNQANRLIFESFLRLANSQQNIDSVTLQSDLDSRHLLDKVGGQNYLIHLQDIVPSAASVRSYVNVVRDRAIKRQVLDCCRRLSDYTYENTDLEGEDILDKAEHDIFEIAENRIMNESSGPQPLAELIKPTMERLKDNMSRKGGVAGVASGFTELDKKTNGFHEGELIILAARPSMGKTTLAMNIVEHAFLNPENTKPVLVFSLEMPAWQLNLRMLSSISRIELEKLSRGTLDSSDCVNLGKAVSLMKERGDMLYIDDQTGLSPMDVRTRARKIARERGGISLIMIDYLQHMSIPGYGTDKQQEVSEISRSLKQLAMELNVPVIALSQLNRSLENRTDKRPMNSDLRESGAIEQDADLIMFIYRDEYYHKDSKDKGLAEIIIGKQRNGPTGTTKLLFENKFSRFSNYTRDYDDPSLQPPTR
ncbi:MAG: replicative DNA helicase [Succinivibrionaceae bacterium]